MIELSPKLLAILERAQRWWTGIFLIAFVAAYLALASGLIDNERIVVGLGVLLGLGALSMVADTLQRVTAVQEILQESRPLLKLADCYEDLAVLLAARGSRQKLAIDHLGLSLGQAQDYFGRLWRGHRSEVSRLELRILMLCGDTADLPSALPPEVHEWCAESARKTPSVKTDLGALSTRLTRLERVHSIELRTYASLPTVHGFRVRQPIAQRYFSFCRWAAGPRYDWGEFKYHQISGEPVAPMEKDLADIFDGQFQYLWRGGTAIGSWSWPPGA